MTTGRSGESREIGDDGEPILAIFDVSKTHNKKQGHRQ